MKTKPIALVLIGVIFFLGSVSSYARETEYKLQPTDVIRITVHEQPDLETKTRVSKDGYITFPLIGKVRAEGLTIQELEITIKEDLEKDYLVTAQVLAFIETYHPRQVSVMGEVNTPGKYDMPEQKEITLLEAIAMAGGFTEDADKNKTRVMRTKEDEQETIIIRVRDITEKGEKEKDIVLEPGDVVFVPESFF